LSLFLESLTLSKTLSLDLTNAAEVASLKEHPIKIKEGVDYKCVPSTTCLLNKRAEPLMKRASYSVGITFKVNHGITSGVRYIQIVKRAGVKGRLRLPLHYMVYGRRYRNDGGSCGETSIKM